MRWLEGALSVFSDFADNLAVLVKISIFALY